MEVVGLVVAVGSIAKAGCVAVKFASTIRQVAKEAGTVGQRIDRTSHMFQTFGKAIKAAESSMQRHYPKTADSPEDSPAIKYMKDNDFLGSLQSQSCMIRSEILAHETVIRSVISERGPRWLRELITGWNWVKMEEQIMNLHPHMESVKSNMIMALLIITLEVAIAKNKSHPSLAQQEEIQDLKTKIGELIDDMRYLRKSVADMQVPVYHASNSSVHSLSPQVDLLKVICHLGHSLVEREAIPTEPPESFSFKEEKRIRQYRRRHSRKLQSNNPLEVPAPARHEQVVQPRSSGTPPPGPLPSSPHPQKIEPNSPNPRPISPYGYGRDSSSGTPPPGPLPSSLDPQKTEPNSPNTHSTSPYEYRREGLYRYKREDDRLQPVNTTGQDHDLFDLEPRSRRTGSPRQSIVTAEEAPTPIEDHSTDIPDPKRRIPRVADVAEPETPSKDQRPALRPLSHTESVQAVDGEVNNARARRVSRKQRKSSATITSADMAARYGNLKPRPSPRSPPKSVEDTRDEMDHSPARNLKRPTTVDKPNGPSGSDAWKPESGGPRKGVIDLRGVADTDHDGTSSPSRPKRKGSPEARHIGVTVQTEPTPPQTPISPTQSSPMFAPPSHSAAFSPSPSSAPRSNVIPQPHRQPPSPPGQATSASQTRKSSTKNEIETAYVINPRTHKKKPFQVYIDRKYAINLITLSYARELGLAIMDHHNLNELPYRGTTIALVGRATLMWSTVPGSTLVDPESVEVDVFEDSEELEHPVIFGKWFVGARKNLNIEEMKEEESLDVERDPGVGYLSV